jgi:hypothetical protein
MPSNRPQKLFEHRYEFSILTNTRMWIHNGNVKRTCRRRYLPWREFSPLFNSPARAEDHGIASSGEVAFRLVEHCIFVVSGAQLTILENAGKRIGFNRRTGRLKWG